jgi:hypothetical protein
MQTHTPQRNLIQPRLRAMVEVVDGELKIFPVADSDHEADEIIKGFWKAVDER